MDTIQNNAVASVHYTGTLPDTGEVFDSSEGRDPLVFLVGHRQMISGFEEEMLGAKVGERQNVHAWNPSVPTGNVMKPT